MADRVLPEDFAPSDRDVICGWARQNYHHAGNCRLRKIIAASAIDYLNASDKVAKSKVINNIIKQLRKDSPSGVGLVRVDKDSGRWMCIGDDKAKDKVGHALRKASARHSKKSIIKEAIKKSTSGDNETPVARTRSSSNADSYSGNSLATEEFEQADLSLSVFRQEYDPPRRPKAYRGPSVSPIRSAEKQPRETKVEGDDTGDEKNMGPPPPHYQHHQHMAYPPMPPPWDIYGRPIHPAYHHYAPYYGYTMYPPHAPPSCPPNPEEESHAHNLSPV